MIIKTVKAKTAEVCTRIFFGILYLSKYSFQLINYSIKVWRIFCNVNKLTLTG